MADYQKLAVESHRSQGYDRSHVHIADIKSGIF